MNDKRFTGTLGKIKTKGAIPCRYRYAAMSGGKTRELRDKRRGSLGNQGKKLMGKRGGLWRKGDVELRSEKPVG